ncbi:TetR/AcrR family transcriptional regulator [Streptococcus ovuberis]|uniref:TetR family transcriptional regulator n=1 Tax=Streptococcus ovuberis TaxID=1936207 RepID=A0A7X6MXR8_9STRE|nr:TetR/AcrR family transcriptional regulator [Streptococcus ovuberis]NKZ20295.1 TetR family transcriptional regulator [Streptococcus ovuberis]
MPDQKTPQKSTQHLQAFNKEANQLTRESLETALLFLLEKKELAKISVSELVQKAGVSRNAFYRNYQSKEQLLEEIFEKVIRRIFKEMRTNSKKQGQDNSWLTLFKEAKKEAKLFQIAFRYNFEKRLSTMLSEFLSGKEEASTSSEEVKETDYTNSFWSSAIVATLAKWVSDGMKISEEKMANLGLPFFSKKK